MKSVLKYFKDRKAAGRQVERERSNALALKTANSKIIAHERLSFETAEMHSSPCVLSRQHVNCVTQCVHFQEGRIAFQGPWKDEDTRYPGLYYVISPRCKLWGQL